MRIQVPCTTRTRALCIWGSCRKSCRKVIFSYDPPVVAGAVRMNSGEMESKWWHLKPQPTQAHEKSESTPSRANGETRAPMIIIPDDQIEECDFVPERCQQKIEDRACDVVVRLHRVAFWFVVRLRPRRVSAPDYVRICCGRFLKRCSRGPSACLECRRPIRRPRSGASPFRARG